MKNNIVESILHLQELSFERLEFKRQGPKNSNEIEYRLSVQTGSDSDTGIFKTLLNLKANKKDEYEIEITIQGVFSFSSSGEEISDSLKKNLIQKNSVAIMMPYVRSQLTLLTSQPGVDPVVMPPLNINAMLDSKQ